MSAYQLLQLIYKHIKLMKTNKNKAVTEKIFVDYFEKLCVHTTCYIEGKMTHVKSMINKVNNKFYISYHLYFYLKNINFNFYLERLNCYNSTESVSITIYDKNQKYERDRSRSILRTTDMNELIKTVENIYLQHEDK